MASLGRSATGGLRRALALVAVLAAAGCAVPTQKICPRVAISGQLSSLTKFAPGGEKPGDVLLRAEMTGVEMECEFFGDVFNEMISSVNLTIDTERGPALANGVTELRYFAAVTDRAGTMLSKRIFRLRLDFQGRSRLKFVEEINQQMQIEKGGGANFEVWFGFQLSDTELEYNRGRPAR